MKKLITLLLASMLCLMLCACGEDTPLPSGTHPSTDPTHTHTWAEATCATPKICTACGETEGEALGHDHQETAKVEATVTEDGSVTYICAKCGQSSTEVLYATGSLGLKYSLNDDGTYTLVGTGLCNDSQIVIPAYYQGGKVTAIGRRAFAEKKFITSISIPDTVQTIAIQAFYACPGLTEITIPSSVTSIGPQIFYKCDALHTVYYNSSYDSQYNPLIYWSSIKKIVFGGSSVPVNFCRQSTTIEEVILLDSVTSIGDYAFQDCTNLRSITILGNPHTMGDCTFQNCSNLQSFTIPQGVTAIGVKTFEKCVSLQSVVIPDSVTSIGNSAFSECSSLQSVTIPEGVTSIGDRAFYCCYALQSVTIPEGVTSLSGSVFSNCSSLQSINIPGKVTDIDKYALAGCEALKNIHFGGTIAQWNSISKINSWNYYTGEYTVHCTDGQISKVIN